MLLFTTCDHALTPHRLAFPFLAVDLTWTASRRLTASTGKAKAKTAADDDDDEDDDDDSEVSPDEAEDDDGEFKVPTSIKTGSRKRAPPGTSPGPLPKARAPRAKKAARTATKAAGTRKRKAAADGDDDEDAEGAPAAKKATTGKDFKIANDNGLFSASPLVPSCLTRLASRERPQLTG